MRIVIRKLENSPKGNYMVMTDETSYITNQIEFVLDEVKSLLEDEASISDVIREYNKCSRN